MDKKAVGVNYYQLFFNEGSPFYNNLNNVNENAFNSFCVENLAQFGTYHSFEDIIPSKLIVNEFIELGYIHRASQCHYSAKAISLLDPTFEYWTGFIHCNDLYSPIITHSFNIKDDRIIDFSRLDIDLNIIQHDYGYFPNAYYALRIPEGFIDNYRYETLAEFSMNPLIVDYYLSLI